MKKNIRIAITMGDPAGIGSEIIIKSLARHNDWRVSFLVIGDFFVLNKTAKRLGLINVLNKLCSDGKKVIVVDLKNVDEKKFRFGTTDIPCGKASIEYIAKAVSLIKLGKADALVTAPISKESVNAAGFNWPGHTEFLAHLAKTEKYCMMLVAGALKVILATRHIAIKDVNRRLNTEEIYYSIVLANNALKNYFGIKNPKIAVCALNPHAGEGGLFSDEEKRIIIPAVKKAQSMSIKVFGPLPADSLFYDAYKGKFDAEVAMYHDQGLVPLKMIGKDIGVNVTLGLPFVRTSPAHGTAFDIAGKNMANPSSMTEAINLAIKMTRG